MLKYHFNISEDIKAVVQVQQLLVYIYGDVLSIYTLLTLIRLFFVEKESNNFLSKDLKNKKYLNTVLFKLEKDNDDEKHFSKGGKTMLHLDMHPNLLFTFCSSERISACTVFCTVCIE